MYGKRDKKKQVSALISATFPPRRLKVGGVIIVICGKLLCWNLDEGCDMESLQKNICRLLIIFTIYLVTSFLEYKLRSLENRYLHEIGFLCCSDIVLSME